MAAINTPGSAFNFANGIWIITIGLVVMTDNAFIAWVTVFGHQHHMGGMHGHPIVDKTISLVLGTGISQCEYRLWLHAQAINQSQCQLPIYHYLTCIPFKMTLVQYKTQDNCVLSTIHADSAYLCSYVRFPISDQLIAVLLSYLLLQY